MTNFPDLPFPVGSLELYYVFNHDEIMQSRNKYNQQLADTIFFQTKNFKPMKAEIKESGMLVVTADSPTEQYALKQWSKNYDKGDMTSSLALNYESHAASKSNET
jgi:hypothetical protein